MWIYNLLNILKHSIILIFILSIIMGIFLAYGNFLKNIKLCNILFILSAYIWKLIIMISILLFIDFILLVISYIVKLVLLFIA